MLWSPDNFFLLGYWPVGHVQYLEDQWNFLLHTLLPSVTSFPEMVHAIWEWQLFGDPLYSSLMLLAFSIFGSFVLAFLTDNYSWVDRLWSLVPIAYAWIFLVDLFWSDIDIFPVRPFVMTILITLWGCRLTYNFYRKGGYHWKDEDYRWAFVRKWFPDPFTWQLFNLLFISLFQHALLWSITLPVYVSTKIGLDQPWSGVDSALAVAFSFLLLLETVADQQQFNFQTRKYSLLKSKKRNELKGDFKRGFLTLGAFRYSRHPNFFAEFSMWFVLYVFTVRVTSVWLNFTLIGPVVLWSLFQGSTWLTESICCGKYPEYRDYQSMTSRLIPWFPGPSTWKEA